MAEGALRTVLTGRNEEITDELLEGLPEDNGEDEIVETIVAQDDGVSYPYGKPTAQTPATPAAAPPIAAAPSAPPPAVPPPTAPRPTAPAWGTTEALAGVRQTILSFLESAEQRLADADTRLAQAKQNLARAEADREQQLASLHELMAKLGLPHGPQNGPP